MLSHVVGFLHCPVCRTGLTLRESALQCAGGHGFDVARQGYVNLLAGQAAHRGVDTAAMVGARARFLAAGYYEGLAELLAARCHEFGGEKNDETCVLDVGAGTGYHLEHILRRHPGRAGVALDISKHAARRAARAHPRIGAVVADAWKPLPIRSASVGIALVAFAPRAAAELHRVLAGAGRLLVVAPTSRHLREVIEPLGLLHVGQDKDERSRARLGSLFERVARDVLELRLHMPAEDLVSLVEMGPSAWHVPLAEVRRRVERLTEPVELTASFAVSVYRPR